MDQPRHFRLVIAFALLAVVLRVPAFLYPVFGETEASEAAVAVAVKQGAELYRDVPAPEPPLSYLWMATQYSVFGELSQRAVHVMSLLALLSTIAILALAARALGGDRGRILAALFFAVFSAAQPPPALGATSELWAVLCASASLWLVLGGAPARRYGLLFAAGALAATGAMLRHESLAVAPAALAYLLLWRPAMLGRPRLKPGIAGSLAFVLGFAVVYALPLAYLQSREALSAFATSAWSDASGGPRVALLHALMFVLGAALLWFLAARELWRIARGLRVEVRGSAGDSGSGAGVSSGTRELQSLAGHTLRGEDDAAASFVATWLFAALLLLCLRGRFEGGDFLHVLPPLVLIAARAAASIADDFWSGPLARLFRLGIAIPVAVFFGAGLFHEVLYRGVGVPILKTRPIVKAVRDATEVSDRILVLGPARRVYVIAPRAPAPSFLALQSTLLGATTVEELPSSLRTAPPRLVVDAGGPRGAALRRFLDERYAPLMTIDGVLLSVRREPRAP